MMGLQSTIVGGAAVVTAIGSIGGGALYLNNIHEPRGQAEKVRTELMQVTGEIQSDMRVDRIFRMVEQARAEGAAAWLCEALEKEFVALCTDQPDNYLCRADARRDLKTKAGCI